MKKPNQRAKHKKFLNDIYRRIKKMKPDWDREQLYLFVSGKGDKVIYQERLFLGGAFSCTFCLNTIFRRSLLHEAHRIIFCHNHVPVKKVKDLDPSYADLETLSMAYQIGEILKIGVHESMLFNEKGFVTFMAFPSKNGKLKKEVLRR